MSDPITDAPGADVPYLAEAREQGFRQFVKTIAKTFVALPATWLFIVAVAHEKVPLAGLASWVGAFFVTWLASVLALRRFDRAGPRSDAHRMPVAVIVVVEGLLWGGMLYVLMGHHDEMDRWAMVLLLGIVSIVLPSYIAYPQAFMWLLASVWVAATVSVLLTVRQERLAWHVVLGLLGYFAALAFTIRPICARVLEGIRLQLLNEALTARLEESLAIASHKADTDALTGQLNRHALNRILGELAMPGDRRPAAFSLLMMDVDFFKAINDQYGHDVGDTALQHVSRCIGSQLRVGDHCARYGGEEFVVLLPATNEEEARRVAERIREAVETTPLPHPRHAITLSIGLANHRTGMSAAMLIKQADMAVYTAKRSGRNQVCVAPALAPV